MSRRNQPSGALRLACLTLVLASMPLCLSGCTRASAQEAPGDDSPAVQVRTLAKRASRAQAAQRPITAARPAPVPGPTGIQISYRLDPWLISGNYGRGFWASPPVLGPASQPGGAFAVQARAEALGGGPIADTEWVASDPDMVTVTPTQGSDVRIVVHRSGQSTLEVRSQGSSKELVIKADDNGDVLQVEIAQQP
jgi:hypothetical protein